MVWTGWCDEADYYMNEKDFDDDYLPNHLFYHEKVYFKGITAETEKAYLLRITKKMELWIPKKICKNMEKQLDDSGCVYIHKETYNKIVKKFKKEHKEEI